MKDKGNLKQKMNIEEKLGKLKNSTKCSLYFRSHIIPLFPMTAKFLKLRPNISSMCGEKGYSEQMTIEETLTNLNC